MAYGAYGGHIHALQLGYVHMPLPWPQVLIGVPHLELGFTWQ